MQKKPEKILLIQTAFLGDVILVTPLIRAAASLFPAARIDALVIPQTAEALRNNPYITDILTFDKRKRKLRSFAEAVRKIRSRRYDLAIAPHSSVTTAWLMVLAGIRRRLGFDRCHAAHYLTMKVPHHKNIHKIKKNLHLLSVFTDQAFDMQTELYPDKPMLERSSKLLSGRTYPGRPLIALAPGSIWFTKRWPAGHYRDLTRMLEKGKFNLVFVGAPDEQALCEQIIAEAGSSAVNLAGKTGILESAAVVQQCDLLVCNDSGAMHIANAMKTDVLAFFGPTVQSIGYFPFRETDRVFEIDLDCRPCGKHGDDACPLGHHHCMVHIKPETVFAYIEKKFSS